MGILEKLFGKKDPPLPPGAGVGFGDFQDTASVHRYPILTASGKGNGPDGWAPRVGQELPSVANQDELLIHFDREDPGNPQDDAGTPYWRNRNFSSLVRWNNVTDPITSGTGGMDSWYASPTEHALQESARRDVKETPPLPSRVTAFESPSKYRFFRHEQGMRGGRGDTQLLNGLHFSMASNRRAYPINGMRPRQNFRNTWRTEPLPRDAFLGDLPANNPTVMAGERTSPTATNTRRKWQLT